MNDRVCIYCDLGPKACWERDRSVMSVKDGLRNLGCSRGITLAEGWWIPILYMGKDIENRHKNVLEDVGAWRGRILLTASVATPWNAIRENWAEWMDMIIIKAAKWSGPKLGKIPHDGMNYVLSDGARKLFELGAGKIVGTIDLVALRPNRTSMLAPDGASPWEIPGQIGLHLANPKALEEPIPYSGGRGVWHVGVCLQCDRGVAIDFTRYISPGKSAQCPRCKGQEVKRLGEEFQ